MVSPPSTPSKFMSVQSLVNPLSQRGIAMSATSPTNPASTSVTSASDEVNIDESLLFALWFRSFEDDSEPGEDLSETMELSSVNIRVRGLSCIHFRYGLKIYIWGGNKQTRQNSASEGHSGSKVGKVSACTLEPLSGGGADGTYGGRVSNSLRFQVYCRLTGSSGRGRGRTKPTLARIASSTVPSVTGIH